MYISYEIRTKFVWSSCEVHMNRKFLLHMYFKWSSCELHMKFICNYVWNIEVAMIFICISFEVHMTHRPELSNEISYEWYEPSVVHLIAKQWQGFRYHVMTTSSPFQLVFSKTQLISRDICKQFRCILSSCGCVISSCRTCMNHLSTSFTNATMLPVAPFTNMV